MSIDHRVPAGVPTGGQFAATARAESDVALDDRPTPLGDALKAADEIRAVTARYTDRLAIAGVAQHVEATYPGAARLAFRSEESREYDSDDGHVDVVDVGDADGNLIDSFHSPYPNLAYGVPKALRGETWGEQADPDADDPDAVDVGYVNLAAALRLDPREEQRRFTDEIASRIAPF